MNAGRLTTKQRAALDLLARPGLSRGRRAGWIGLGNAAMHLDTSREGAAQTFASLVRRGLVEREKAGGVTFYRAAR